MKLFIGTLFTIENEFEECQQSIQRQSYKNFDQYVFRNLPNKLAHTSLFSAFLEKASDYDFLIKVDADMVLVKDTLFASIVEKLQANPWAKILSISVYDFFSDQLIWGLNAYRNNVYWNFEKENLFVDIPEVPVSQYLFDNKEMAPAAIHCKNPSTYQAFHYGVHRGLKVIQRGQDDKKESSSKTHWNALERTWMNFQKTKDSRLALACLGAELTFRGKFRICDLDHSNPRLQQHLEKYLSLGPQGLMFEIQKLRIFNWGFLSKSKRRKVLCLFNG